MQLEPDEPVKVWVEKFEAMLKTNQILFFDSDEFDYIAYFYLETGNIPLAKKAIKLGLEQHPMSVLLKIYKIEILIIEDKLDEAEALLEKVFHLVEDHEDAYIQKANIYSRQNRHSEAISVLEKGLEFTDNPGEIYYLMGLEGMFMNDLENAISNFQKCLELDDEDYVALHNIVFCYEGLQRSDEAIDFLNDYLETHPYSASAWYHISRLYYEKDDYDKSLAAIDFAIFSEDDYLGAYHEKGRILEKLKRYDEAIENYQCTFSIQDPSSHVLLRLGKCYEKKGQKELALDYFLRSVENEPGETKAWNAITDHFYKAGDLLKAQYYIEKAVAVDAEAVSLWKRYGKIHKKLKNLEEAEIGYRKALELGNYELDSWLTRSDLLTNLGEYEDAITNLLQAQEFYPEHPEIEFRLAGLHFSTNDRQKGEYHLHNGLNSEPDFLMILEELFPLVYRMKRVKQIVAQQKKAPVKICKFGDIF